MLLARLVEYAGNSPNLPPPFYAPKLVRWVVELNQDGSLASTQLTDLADSSDRTLRNGTRRLVPSIQRSGTASQPMLAVDTAEYALGWTADEKRADKAPQYHLAFRELVARWHAADPSVAATAAHRFLQSPNASALAPEPELTGSQLVAFRCAGEFLHESESARHFWAAEASGRKGSERTGLCLVCGKVSRLLKTIPQQIPARLVPGATQSAALVSLNKATHVYELQEQLMYTPICVACGLQAMSALESLLGGESSGTFPGQDSRLTWWVIGDTQFDLSILDDPDPTRVAAMLGSAARGDEPGDEVDLSMFCSVTVGGNIARVVVRDWIEQPLTEIKANLRAWIDDHKMVDAWSAEPRAVSITRMASASGRWIPGRGQDRGSYAKFGSSGADRPDGIRRALFAAALLKRPLPARFLAHLVRRVRIDGHLDTERAALIRLALRRHRGAPNPEVYMPTLNKDNHQPAYVAGRIFAVLEDLQYTANKARGSERLNVTFADRYFGRAVTSPAAALVTGRRTARAWLRVLRKKRPDSARAIEQRMDELFAQLDDAGGMPHGTVLAEKAAFILGYHQERATARTRAKDSSKADTSEKHGASA